MDQVKIGKFIAALRKEKAMTQEQLGAKLGVTNKTVSRWETGTYLPDVEMLSLLSQEFGVSLNELVAGEHLAAILLAPFVWIFALVALKLQNVEPALWGGIGGLLAMLFYVVLYNRMMAYVERNAYRPDPEKDGRQ